MAFTKHEDKVSGFYSRIVDDNHNWNEGFLAFGIWKTKSGEPISPPQCFKLLYDELLEGSMIQADHNILEVACGQGAGMQRIKSQYGCQIQGLDISAGNVELAKHRLRDTGIEVTHGSATKMPYDDNSFDCVICVEGSPHFKTRQAFLQEACRVLKPGGKLLMTDVVGLKQFHEYSYLQQIICKITESLWVVPHENFSYGIDTYKQMIKDHGFNTSRFEVIGDRVIPGYCKFNLTPSVIRELAKIRGTFAGYLGGPLIDTFLKLAYSHGLVEYILIVADKPT